MNYATVNVDWEWEEGDGTPPPTRIPVPDHLFDQPDDEVTGNNAVTEYLTEVYSFLVRDWAKA